MRNTEILDVLIIGGGIGGLTLAGVLEKAGRSWLILEQSDVLQEIGAGIQISPNGYCVLKFLGLGDDFEKRACLPKFYHAKNWKSGRTLYKTPLNPEFTKRYGSGYFHIHRADLLRVLIAELPDNRLRLGQKVVDLKMADCGVIAHTVKGQDYRAKIAIGADGIHSVVRRKLLGPDKPRFTGTVAYRFTVDADKVDYSHFIPFDSCNWHGPDGHIVTYFISHGRRINVVAVHETEEWTEESWSLTASKEEFHNIYQTWHPIFYELAEAAESINKWALYDRDPLTFWSGNRMSLLGDAAHPMLPFLAQGANMAIEDGYTIAALLSKSPEDGESALQKYQNIRYSRTSKVQLAARARARVMHQPSAIKRFFRDVRFSIDHQLKRNLTQTKGDWIYKTDVVADHPLHVNRNIL